MDSTTGAALLLAVLAVLMVGAFLLLWVRDRSRAKEEAGDTERIAPPTRVDGPERH
ncbi:hypothetical protein [Marmoricola sp. RAF53]|uniref:hypothetical protein n=1 Tax=Marmoricola sp. RAF53 TaxID=3233059 RepID=UPI003F9D7823